MLRKSATFRDFLRVNGAVLLFGLAGVLGQMTALPALLIVLGRVVIAAPLLLATVVVTRTPAAPKSTRDAWFFGAQGALLALHWFAFFESIRVSSVAIGLLAFSSFPFFTVLLEPTLLHLPLRRSALAGAMVVLLGVAVLVPHVSVTDSTTVGVLWGLLAGGTFALLSVANKWLSQAYSSIVISFYQDSMAAVVLFVVVLVSRTALTFTSSQLLLLVILGSLCTALAHTTFVAGLRTVSAQLASLCASLEPVWGVGFAFLLLGEHPASRTLIGGAIILLATVIPALLEVWAHPPAASVQEPDRA